MTALPMSLRKLAPLAFAAVLIRVPAVLRAQEAPNLAVMNFQSAERELGAKAADPLRDRLSHDIPDRELTIVQTDVIQRALQQSAFPPNDPLDPANELLLARVVEAQYYITGTVVHGTAGYQLFPRLVMTRSATLSQPLPPSAGRDIEAVIRPIAREVREAMKQMPAEQKCSAAAQSGNSQGALSAAQGGIAAYPYATIVRMCALNVYWGTLYPHATSHADSVRYADSTLALARAVAALDSTNTEALRAEAELYTVIGNPPAARQALLALANANPSDVTLANQVVNSLMAAQDSTDALRLVGQLVTKNPDDPHTLLTAFGVYVHTHQWPLVLSTGPKLIRLDTTMADSTYFLRMAAAYQNQNQPQQAIGMLQQGTTKFPNSATLWQVYAQDLRQSGRTADADAALKRAVALNPKMSLALLQLADMYAANHQPDSAYVMLQRATSAPDADRSLIAQAAFAQGARLYQDAKGPTSRADYQQAIRFLDLSNQLSPSTDAQFLSAASSFAVMQSAAQEANTSKSCSLARLADQSAGAIQAGLDAGAKDPKYQASAKQMQQTLPQFRTAIAGELKRFCH